MPRRSGLTSREEIILHLHSLENIEIDIEGPYAATREGMSRALGIRINHVSHELKGLVKSDDVLWKTAHVLGFRKRLRVYYLSETGARKADRIVRSIRDVMVTIADELGNSETLTMEMAIKRMGRRHGYLELLRMRGGGPVVRAATISTYRIPEPELFFGRGDELRALTAWFESGKANILVIYGIAGIGKTALASRFASSLKERQISYLRIREWDSVRGLLESLGNALTGMGDERLQIHLRSQLHEDITNVSLILRDALSSTRSLLILDDIWTASKDLWRVIMPICEAVVESGSRMILVSREFPSRLEGTYEAKGMVTRLRIEGLKDDESRKLLQWRGVTEETTRRELDELVGILRGHPLLLRMLHGTEDIQALCEGDVARFIHREIYSRLSKEEITAIDTLAVLRHPLPATLLTKRLGYDVIESLQRKALIERIGNAITLHDMMRSFVLAYLTENERRRYHQMAREILPTMESQNIEKIYHAISSGLTEDGIQELVHHKDGLITSGHAADILALISEIPEDCLSYQMTGDVELIRMMCLSFTGEYSSVIDLYEKKNGQGAQMPETRLIAADAYLVIGKTERAHEIYSYLMKQSLQEDLTLKVHRGVGKYYSLMGKYALAQGHYLKAFDIAKRTGSGIMIGESLMDLGSIEIYREKGGEATKYLLDAMRYIRSDEYSLARLYTNLSLAYYQRSMHEMALDMQERAENISIRFGDYIGMLKCMLNRSAILFTTERFQEAEEVLLRALDMSRRGGAKQLIGGVLANISSVYLSMGKYKESENAAKDSLRIASELRDERVIIASKNNLAFSLIRQGKAKDCMAMLKKNITDSEGIGIHTFTMDAMAALAEGYHSLGKKHDAILYAKKALRFAKEHRIVSSLKRIERLVKKVEASR